MKKAEVIFKALQIIREFRNSAAAESLPKKSVLEEAKGLEIELVQVYKSLKPEDRNCCGIDLGSVGDYDFEAYKHGWGCQEEVLIKNRRIDREVMALTRSQVLEMIDLLKRWVDSVSGDLD